jgi:hypothetical protein
MAISLRHRSAAVSSDDQGGGSGDTGDTGEFVRAREVTRDGLRPLISDRDRAVAVITFVGATTGEILQTFYFNEPGLAMLPPVGARVTVGRRGAFFVERHDCYYPDPSRPTRLLFLVYVVTAQEREAMGRSV